MARFTVVRAGLVATAKTAVPGIHDYRTVPDAVIVPAVIAQPATPFARYRIRGSGTHLYIVELLFLTGRVAESAAQDRLDEWAADDGPVIPALFDQFDVPEAEIVDITGQSYGSTRVGNTEYAGFALHVDIEA